MPYYIGKAVSHTDFDPNVNCFILFFDKSLLKKWKERGIILSQMTKSIWPDLFCGSFTNMEQYITFFLNPIDPLVDEKGISKNIRSALIQIDESSDFFIFDELPIFLKVFLAKQTALGDQINIDCVIQKFFFPFPDNNELMFTISGYVENTDILLESDTQISISFLEKALADKEFGRWKGEE
jgi:hypothetical protein